MAMNRDELRARIDTIVLVMMENRSFDHLLGHLTLPRYGGRTDVAGLPALDDERFWNPSAAGVDVAPFEATDAPFVSDLPHERSFVETQLDGGKMTGFVRAYEEFTGQPAGDNPSPMGFLTPRDLPVTSFLAAEFAICDRWFSPLPTSTQPNRLMALSGYTVHDTTLEGLLPDQDLVFDWLTRNGGTWRVYSAGLSFFTLMPKMWPELLTDRFRPLAALSYDIQHEADDTWPDLVIIEPDYDESPIHLSGHACDNHPPVPVGFGEIFLKQVYEALTSNARRWQRLVAVYTYDEHGGFFDHVTPPAMPFEPPPGATFESGFSTTGPRVPAVVISPMVTPGSVFGGLLDHTSILQLVAERFGPEGQPFSPFVERRRLAGVGSVADVLSAETPPGGPRPPPVDPIWVQTALSPTRAPETVGQRRFAGAVTSFVEQHGDAALRKYPEIAHWLSTLTPRI